MIELSSVLASIIQERVSQDAQSGAEVRLIFHGPPLEILEPAFSILLDHPQIGNPHRIPVLLQVPALPTGERNPLIGESGRCDATHLLNLRNSPNQSSYIALIPPGQHSIRSVSSTTDEFGMTAQNNSGSASFETWWSDDLIQKVVEIGLDHLGVPMEGKDNARALVEQVARSLDEVDRERSSRRASWRLLSRIFSLSGLKGLSIGEALSLACGVPPMQDGSISPKAQLSALEKIAEALSDGFSSGVERIKEASFQEERLLLDQFLSHIQANCDLPTAFERATAAFYAPVDELAVQSPAAWWKTLTVERWGELLSDEADIVGDLVLECMNGLSSFGKGMPILVADQVELKIHSSDHPDANVDIVVERAPAGSQKEVGRTRLDAEPLIDHAPPPHKAPIRYKATAEGFQPGTIKVISLQTWEPGIFVTCRHIKKIGLPKRPPRRAGGQNAPNWEAGLTLPGVGRYELLIFLSPGVEIEGHADALFDDTAGQGPIAPHKLSVRQIRDGQYQIEAEVDGNLQLDVWFTHPNRGKRRVRENLRISLVCEDVNEEGCASEFERLIKANRRHLEPFDTKTVVQINRSARSATLQDWMLSPDSVGTSYLPIILAQDYVDRWIQPNWDMDIGPILSNGRFLYDPRPARSEFSPPPGFVEARIAIASRIRGNGDQSGLIEAARLGEWIAQDAEFRAIVEKYIDAYQQWLKSEPSVACWVDVIAVTSLESDGRTLSRVPDAVLLSPLHPLRVAWHCVAQSVLYGAEHSGAPCPAASVFDPDCVPDHLLLFLRSPGGTEKLDYIAVENGTDYWSVLWNGSSLKSLPARVCEAPFGAEFGITVGGITIGFSTAQVSRALDDITELMAAKPTLGVVVAGTGGTTDACNDGLINWCAERFDGRSLQEFPLYGPRSVEVFDCRGAESRPDDTAIANLSDDTNNAVRWFGGLPKGEVPDLGIIAQLDMSEPCISHVPLRSPLGYGGLLRHRIRQQLPDAAFLVESRQAMPLEPTGDVLADKVAACISTMENLRDERSGLQFAPNVNALRDILEEKSSEFVAVSSSAVDPACFLGGWLKNTYLWDYDLPSYSRRAGDTNGYYLLSRIRRADEEALAKALSKLPNGKGLSADTIRTVLLEVARRGIPTIRGLSSDDAGAVGNIGLFVAVRLLQDCFRLDQKYESLLPVIGGTEDKPEIAIIIPVDPFRGYLSDIARTLGEKKDISLMRPDLLVVGARICSDGIRVHLTPIEVKCRSGSIFPASEVDGALEQAKALSRLLTSLLPHEGQSQAWLLAFQHLLLSFIGFGMRVYSQHRDVTGQEARWAGFHEKVAAGVLAHDPRVTIDQRGRLIVVDDSANSGSRDHDQDGFHETIVIGRDDAGCIISGDPTEVYRSIQGKLATWELLPPEDRGAVEVGGYPVAEGNGGAELMHEPSNDAVKSAPPASGVIRREMEGQALSGAGERLSQGEVSQGIKLNVGHTVDGFKEKQITLNISDTRLNQLNMGVVGDLGTGKTQFLKSIISQIAASVTENRSVKPRFLIFDYKRDYSSPDFVEATGARVVKPHQLPLNLFDISSLGESAAPWLDRFRFFSDVLDKIYSGVGPVQREKLKRAVRAAYDQALRPAPTLNDVYQIYVDLLDGKADSPMAIMGDLVDMEVFAANSEATIPFDEFLDGVVVISLDALGQDDRSKNMVVAVMLNMFYENMLRTPKRPFIGIDPQLRVIDSYLLVDEADNIMQYEFDVLRKLLLQGREFGVGVILASQYLKHFKVNATDYREPLLTWFIHKVPNISPAELSALGLTGSVAGLAERVKALPNHHCLYKSFDVSGEVIRGLPFFELIKGK